ncbi:unnamed protein product [Acanthoscelides obtectus]|uniref:Uncharacterized protein n=1 Tax=Acanthoscelides obtectus TaxID=200917 RepID=A0A9P0PGT4_ACAOB|nr:unnamed protein product [Acanthoscelides obtectus]CAK1649526.1 hypothetical protein AOBTE_LOCUS16294 [Acanthoscelides obtectus]
MGNILEIVFLWTLLQKNLIDSRRRIGVLHLRVCVFLLPENSPWNEGGLQKCQSTGGQLH